MIYLSIRIFSVYEANGILYFMYFTIENKINKFCQLEKEISFTNF